MPEEPCIALQPGGWRAAYLCRHCPCLICLRINGKMEEAEDCGCPASLKAFSWEDKLRCERIINDACGDDPEDTESPT